METCSAIYYMIHNNSYNYHNYLYCNYFEFYYFIENLCMSETKNECPSTGRDSIWPEPDLHSYYHPYLHSSQQSISTPICYYIFITFSYAAIYISVTPLFTFVLPPLFTFLPAEHNHCACSPHYHHIVIQILFNFQMS